MPWRMNLSPFNFAESARARALQAVHLGLVLVPALHALHLAELLEGRLHAGAPAHVQLRPPQQR